MEKRKEKVGILVSLGPDLKFTYVNGKTCANFQRHWNRPTFFILKSPSNMFKQICEAADFQSDNPRNKNSDVFRSDRQVN